ncbi:MAG: DUF4180 domain-containing protein [Bacillota bacterium]
MQITVDEKENSKVAIVHSNEMVITDVQDALDLMATVRHVHECAKIVLAKQNICEDFFDLKTGVAGEILQKFTNYQVKLAIVGDFEGYTSKALKDFIFESNNGSQVFFLPDEQTALEKLHSVR